MFIDKKYYYLKNIQILDMKIIMILKCNILYNYV